MRIIALCIVALTMSSQHVQASNYWRWPFGPMPTHISPNPVLVFSQGRYKFVKREQVERPRAMPASRVVPAKKLKPEPRIRRRVAIRKASRCGPGQIFRPSLGICQSARSAARSGVFRR